jgi:hypothetical protein
MMGGWVIIAHILTSVNYYSNSYPITMLYSFTQKHVGLRLFTI